MFAHIGRQAIFDKGKTVVGYELLYRDGASGNRAYITDDDAATRGVLSDAITVFGLNNLTNHLPAYINFTRDLILDHFALLADPDGICIEIGEDMVVDDELFDCLRELKRAGYTLALDNYWGAGNFDDVLSLFSVVKIDISETSSSDLQEMVKRLKKEKIVLAAGKVETEEDFKRALQLGFTMFQGYYFAKPSCLSRRIPSLAASAYGRLFNELQKPELNYDACSQIVRQDASLTYLLLRQVQTANYYHGNRIEDVRQGMVMLGAEELRRWLMLALVRQNNITHSDELPRQAYLRGLFIERLMRRSPSMRMAGNGFLLGMFSLLDRITGTQIQELLADLNLDPALTRALMGTEENRYTLFLQYAIIYELGNSRLMLPDLGLTVGERGVSELYMKCFFDVDEAFRGMGATRR